MIRKAALAASLLLLFALGVLANGVSSKPIFPDTLLDYTLTNRDSDTLGTVDNVVVDLESDKVRYTIIEFPLNSYSFTKAAFVPSAESHTAVQLYWQENME